MAAYRTLWLAMACCVAFFCAPTFGEEAEAAVDDDAAKKAAEQKKLLEDENDPTNKLLKQLTITMAEVVDERTVSMRHTSSKDKRKTIHLRLGNTGPVPRGALNDADYQEKVDAAKAALTKMVDKQMVWYKAAPDASQLPGSEDGSPDVVLADMWSKGGKHINTVLKTDGHLSATEEYSSELAHDILGAAAETAKAESYKKLEEALKENDQHKKEQDKVNRAKAKEQEAEEAAAEGFGFGGWIGIVLLLALIGGVATNFGQGSGKKQNLNRKKGVLERFWTKLKGA